jgi:hypothetical protein
LLPSFDACDVARPLPCLSIVPSMEEGRSACATILILELHAVFFRPPSLPPCLACCYALKMMNHLKILEVLPPCKEIIITLFLLFILQCLPFATSLLTDKRRIPLRSASLRTPHLFHHGISEVLVNPRSKGITSVRSTFTL